MKKEKIVLKLTDLIEHPVSVVGRTGLLPGRQTHLYCAAVAHISEGGARLGKLGGGTVH